MPVINTSDFHSVEDLKKAILESNDMTLLLINGQLYTVSPAEIARDKIAEKIAMRLAENPSILHDLQCRLEKEEPQDWE